MPASRPPAPAPGQNPEFGPDRALQELLEARIRPDRGRKKRTWSPDRAQFSKGVFVSCLTRG